MDDILEIYRELKSPEAQRWNLTHKNLYVEYNIRKFFSENINLKTCKSICNVGIGAGEWDDFLGYMSEGICRITSIDVDKNICCKFELRQNFESHPNPSIVLNDNVLNNNLMWESFDLVTVIGSTIAEIGNYELALSQCLKLLKKNGLIFYSDFYGFNEPVRFVEFTGNNRIIIHHHAEFREIESVKFYIFIAQKL